MLWSFCRISSKPSSLLEVLAFSIWFFMASSLTAIAANPITYVCIEQKSVGWHTPKGQKEFVGQFAVDNDRFFIKYYAGDFDPSDAYVEVPFVEEIRHGRESVFLFSGCDQIFRDSFIGSGGGFYKSSAEAISLCQENIGIDDTYANGGHWTFRFDPQISKRPSSMTYVNILNANGNLFASSGVCTSTE